MLRSNHTEVQDLTQENKDKQKEIDLLNLASTKSKSKKEMQSIVNETISCDHALPMFPSPLRGSESRNGAGDAASSRASRDAANAVFWIGGKRRRRDQGDSAQSGGNAGGVGEDEEPPGGVGGGQEEGGAEHGQVAAGPAGPAEGDRRPRRRAEQLAEAGV